MYIRWIEIAKFRHAESTRLEFGDGMHVLVGRNGTGKTNLLELLSMVSRWDFSELAEEAFDVKWRVEDGEGQSVEAHVHPVEPPSELGEFEPERRRFEWRATVSLALRDAPEVRMKLSPGQLWVNDRDLPEGHEPPSVLDDSALLMAVMIGLGAARIQSRPMELLSGTLRIDEGLDGFRSLTDSQATVVQIVAFRSQLVPLVSVMPSDLKSTLSSLPPEELQSPHLTFDSQRWPFLNTLARTLGVESMTATLPQLRTRRRNASTLFEYGGPQFMIRLADGSSFRHDALSFGQKRLLAFLWSIASHDTAPVFVDELANGLHHDWIEMCIDRIGTRQAFLTTQNPLLLDFLEFEDAGHARSSVIQCAHGSNTGWNWHHMSTEEAEDFFQAYKIGYRHVSEILRNKGLW